MGICGSKGDGAQGSNSNMSDVTPVMPPEAQSPNEAAKDKKIKQLRDMRNDIVFNAPPEALTRQKNSRSSNDMEQIIKDALNKNEFLKDLLSDAGKYFEEHLRSRMRLRVVMRFVTVLMGCYCLF